MTTKPVEPQLARIVFQFPFDDRAAAEAAARGFLSNVVVELTSGVRYPVVFYDPVRLSQDLEDDASRGLPFMAEPGLIIVPEVKLEIITTAVRELAKRGYFGHLKPLS
jgi:hypothetical protein